MKKLVRYGIKATIWIIGLLVALWIIGWIYVGSNEKALIASVSAVITKQTRGEVSIGGLSVSLIRTFPSLSLQLSDITVRDSLYAIHKQDLFTAKDVYLSLSIPGLIAGNSPVGEVMIRNGSINLLTDTTGYSNEYVLKQDKKQPETKKKSAIPDIILKNVLITYANPLRNKLHQIMIKSLRSSISDNGELMQIGIKTRMQIRSLAFNTTKGSYLKDKVLKGNFDVVFDKSKDDLVINDSRLDLDDQPFYFNGKFHIDKVLPVFNLSITTKNVNFSKAASFMTDSAKKKMLQYAFSKPVDLEVVLSGKTLYKFIPLVNVKLDVKNNKLTTPQGMFEDCTFKAAFTNEIKPDQPRVDENAVIRISDFSGRWEKILISSKSAKLSNLVHPFLECDLVLDVDMQSLNSLSGSATLKFLSGKASVNIVFKGPVNGRDSIASNINGEVNIHNAEINYLPRDFLLSRCNGSLRFSNNNLSVNKLVATVGKTTLQMNANAKNFLSLLNVSPQKLVMHWNISSPHIWLSDFKVFLSRAEEKKSSAAKARFGTTSAKVDRMFSDGDVFISLSTPVLEYKAFRASAVKAGLVLKKTGIELENVSFNQAGGTMTFSGSMRNGVDYNPVVLHSRMTNMDIPLLFKAFDNFGQDAITHENLKGKLSAEIGFNTAVTNKAEIVREASEGTIDFVLKNGELNNFEPMEAISEKVFKKQDFSEIKFAELRNRLDIKGSAFIINPMEIRSTALNFSVEGVYDVVKGTDMSIRLPFQNFTKSQANTDISKGGKPKKGLGVRIRARTGDDGKLNITWDPFKRSVRNRKDVKDSADEKN